MRAVVAGSEVYAYTGSRPVDAALPTVLFVHGAGNDHSVWTLQARYFAHHGFNAVAVDLPGHGKSGGAALASVEAIAGWIRDFVDVVSIDKAALVGHSLGSLAALECAPEELMAWLGPAIGPCCYEVGPEVAGRFPPRFSRPSNGDRFLLDFPGIVVSNHGHCGERDLGFTR